MANLPGSYWKGTVLATDTQFGDTGKGKLVDEGAQYADVIIKTNGGANAGHTVCNKYGEFKLHLIPAGIFNPEALCLIGSGVVVDPLQFAGELEELLDKKVPLAKCLLSKDSHLVLPWHKIRDSLREKNRGEGKIGTTGRGIGPTFADRTNREGLRVGDLLDSNFEKRFMQILHEQERVILAMGGGKFEDYFDKNKTMKQLREAREVIMPRIINTAEVIYLKKEEGKNILGEAGQGALLDLDFGGYPYVTSSHPGVIGFMLSTGLSIKDIDKVVGSTKAYMTRVGEGPMPTEQDNEIGDYLQKVGGEIGATTGRIRRCGWFDIPATEYGARTSGVTTLALMKLDVLDGLDEIKVCTGYQAGDRVYNKLFDIDPVFCEGIKPVYQTFKGWKQPTTEVRLYDDLPQRAKEYISFIEEGVGIPIKIVSVGPDRQATIYR